MLLQTNSYIVPKDKRAEHARLLRRFRAALAKLGCDSFEVYEQVGSNWTTSEPTGRYVQIMRFRDRRHQLAVQAAERSDPAAQAIIAEFCQLINFPYQQQQGLFAVGFYNSVLPVAPSRPQPGTPAAGEAAGAAAGAAAGEAAAEHGAEEQHADALTEEAAADEGAQQDEVPGAEEEQSVDAADAFASEDDVPTDSADEEAPPAEESAALETEVLAADGDAEQGESGEGPAGQDEIVDHDEVAAAEPEEPAPLGTDASSDGAGTDDAAAETIAPEEAADELGALLESHMHHHEGGESPIAAAHPLHAHDDAAAADASAEGLDTLDLTELDIIDEPAANPHAAPVNAEDASADGPDALDLSELDLVDEPANDPHPARDHAAR